MIERLSTICTNRMISENIISENEYNYYQYRLLLFIESVVGHSILLIIAFCCGFVIKTAIFLFAFDLLRGYTNGYHCETNIGCNFLSVFTLLWIRFHEFIFLEEWDIYQGGVILSMIFIIIIGAINHPNMSLSEEEFHAVSRKARIIAVLLTSLFFILSFCDVERAYLYYLGMGIVQTFISVVLAKMIMKGGVINAER